MSISDSIARIREKIYKAEVFAGVPQGTVALVAVSKFRTAEEIAEAGACKVEAFGENYVQELLEKRGAYGKTPVHMIGALQRNKVKKLVGNISLIQSVDSVALMAEISKCAHAQGIVQDILIEVNIAEEQTKSGFYLTSVDEVVAVAAGFEGIRLRGMMSMPGKPGEFKENFRFFADMYKLFVDIGAKKYDNRRKGAKTMDILSMGMSADFEAAISAGANMIRIGTEIFGERKAKYC